MNTLLSYAKRIATQAGQPFVACEVFAKVLTSNDDSGRHGVLIPSDAYAFFPHFEIHDPAANATLEFSAFNSLKAEFETIAYKYYERYPERRITRLPGMLNGLAASPRIFVCLRAKLENGSHQYYFDCGNSLTGGRFDELFQIIFGSNVIANSGTFVIRSVDSDHFRTDAALEELLGKFDTIKNRGWVDSLRVGDTGIGYTFETLLGLKENNNQKADFKGIEIKCKGKKETGPSTSSKINLFQQAPTWMLQTTARELIRILGQVGEDGRFSCYSQVTAKPNNLSLLLDILRSHQKINLNKNSTAVGFWSFDQLEKRLLEKHSRAVFVKASVRNTKNKNQFFYEELVYCDQPSIDRFVNLAENNNIVFEFTMSEKSDGTIRNHGYPWRLVRSEFLDQLFAFQIKLR